MNKIDTIFYFSLVFSFSGFSQPGTAKLTSEKKVPSQIVEISIPSKFKGSKLEKKTLNVPKGYKVSLFHTGQLSKCRFMDWGPDSVLYVANMNSGDILALPDRDHDLVADTCIVAARGAYGHCVTFFEDAMYVAEEKKVLRLTDTDKDGYYETRSIFIDSILSGKKRPPGGHTTRTLVFDKEKKKVYLSVGSLCNICREEERGVIYAYDLSGKNGRIYARGARNCVGMTLDPVTGELWATNNGSDNQGDEIPPEWIDIIREGGFYGYPFAYGYQKYLDFNIDEEHKKILPITKEDSALVRSMKEPEAQVKAHSAPMAIEFSNKSFKGDRSAFVAYRGSWNAKKPTGYKVVRLHFNKKNKISAVSDFLTGFLKEGEEKPWARPVGLKTDLRGNLYMGSDEVNEFILVVSPLK